LYFQYQYNFIFFIANLNLVIVKNKLGFFFQREKLNIRPPAVCPATLLTNLGLSQNQRNKNQFDAGDAMALSKFTPVGAGGGFGFGQGNNLSSFFSSSYTNCSCIQTP
jgi:hypothetical protein